MKDVKFKGENGNWITMIAQVTMIESGSDEYVMLTLPHAHDNSSHPPYLEEFYVDEQPGTATTYGAWSIYIIPADRVKMNYYNNGSGRVDIVLDDEYSIMNAKRHNLRENDFGKKVPYEFLDKEYFYTIFERYPAYDKLITTISEHQINAHPVVVKKYTIDDKHIDDIGKDIQTYLFNGYEIQSNNTVAVGDDVINVITYVHPEYIK